MHEVVAEIVKFVNAVLIVLVMFVVLSFFVALNSEREYENTVVKYIQAAGGVTPSVMLKADALSAKQYHNYFKLIPNGAGKPYTTTVTEKGKKVKKTYQGAYPIELSTDHNHTPIFPVLTDHQDKNFTSVTDRGCLMALLDHTGKLFAGQSKDFNNYGGQSKIPETILASKIKEIKPIGYLDKNYFFNLERSNNSLHTITIWPYKLKNFKSLTDQTRPAEYTHDALTNGISPTREYSSLVKAKINADNSHVHFNDKKRTGWQNVTLVFGNNGVDGEAYPNRWSDVKANSYPHEYGSQIKYNIKISIPYVTILDMMKAQTLRYQTTKQAMTSSLYREIKH